MRRLREDGLAKVSQGRTSIAEVARVIGATSRTRARAARPDGDPSAARVAGAAYFVQQRTSGRIQGPTGRCGGI